MGRLIRSYCIILGISLFKEEGTEKETREERWGRGERKKLCKDRKKGRKKLLNKLTKEQQKEKSEMVRQFSYRQIPKYEISLRSFQQFSSY